MRREVDDWWRAKWLEVVKCSRCRQDEYYGMMHWLNGETVCRQCIYRIWEQRDRWKRGKADYTFPYFSDGVNYTEERSE